MCFSLVRGARNLKGSIFLAVRPLRGGGVKLPEPTKKKKKKIHGLKKCPEPHETQEKRTKWL